MLGLLAAVLAVVVLIGALWGLLGSVTVWTAFVFSLAFPLLFLTGLVAVALRDPHAPRRVSEADRLERAARQRMVGRLPQRIATRGRRAGATARGGDQRAGMGG